MRIEIDMEDFERKLNVAMQKIAFKTRESMKKKLTPQHGRDTSNLMANIQYEVDKNEITFTFPEYALYLEYGTPGQISAPAGLSPNPSRKYPMFKEGDEWHSYLEDWVARKMGTKDPGVNFMVARHIALYGSRPYPFIRTTFKQDVGDIIRQSLIEAFA
jgi:hypothetical protein